MLQIILLIAAISALIRLPKIRRRTAANYPEVSPEKFKLWHEADLKATVAFVIATWGAFALQIIILVIGNYVKLSMTDYEESIDIILIVSTVVIFLFPLLWPAILGSKASRLKKEIGIVRKG
ncbi:MAG: hypothetical protein PHQ96_04105 [Candidatus Omnitrophica bacterium]|nr:hypothetical protein [Candidatus Omnitrophota bacterium]